jgi:phosphatidyl-myo-inositol dimannoside synthase
MVRTLWLTNDLPPRPGGIEQFLANLLRRADPDEALVLGPAAAGAETFDPAEPYEVRRLPTRRVLPTSATLRQVRAASDRHRPDVIVLGAAWPLGELAGALRRDPGVPVVALTHGHEAGFAAVGLGWLVGRATRELAAVTTISEHTERALAPHLRAARTRRIPPGVDVSSFSPAVDGTPMRERWGVPADAPVVGCVSRLVRRKGQDTLLAAWPRIRAAVPEAWLVLVGTGPLERRLRATVADLGPDPNVVVAGPVGWHELPATYAALDVFAMPCRTRLAGLDVEGLGIVYLEAQASGVPVVAGGSGGAPETLLPGRTGEVVDGRDPDAVAEAVAALLGDGTRRARFAEAGRTWTVEHWSWEVISARFRDLLEEVSGEV